MYSVETPEKDKEESPTHRYKCKVRDNQEVGRWKKSEHENFIKGELYASSLWECLRKVCRVRFKINVAL